MLQATVLFADICTYTSLLNVSFETVRRVHVTNEPFTADNGLLTATFKIKRWVPFIFNSLSFRFLLTESYLSIYRKDAYNHFKKELEALYKVAN